MSHHVDDTYSVYHELHPIARKDHQCDACKETVTKGSTYTRCSYVWEGTAYTVKRCTRCQTLHEHLRELGAYEEMWPAEKLDCGEEYKAHWGKEPPPEIAALAFWRPGDPLPSEVTKATTE